MSGQQLDRRSLLKAAGMVGAAASAPSLLAACSKDEPSTAGAGSTDAAGQPTAPASSPAAGEPLTFVSLYGTSGTQAELGQEAADGLALVPQSFGGELLGAPLDVTMHDTQGKLDEAVRRAREEAAAGARFFFGGLLSNVALAVGEEVNRSGGLLATGAGADEITGTECREAVFRWSVATYGAVHETVEPLVAENPDLKRWYTITPDYVFGHSLLSETQNVLSEYGAEHVGNSFHGLDATEFSGFVNNAAAEEPDVLCLLNFGSQSTTTIQQALSFGLKEQLTIVLVWSGGLSQIKALGPEMMEGVYAGAQYWHTVDAPGNTELVDLFNENVGGNPSYAGALGFVTGKLIATGVEEAGSTEPAEVVAALEGLQYEGPTGTEEVRAEDHQVIKDYYLMRGKSADEMADEDDLMEIVSSGKSATPLDQSECTLQPLGT